MRKLLCSLLVVVMVLSLAGCSSKNEESAAADSEKTVLTFWGHQEESWNKSYETIAEQFMKENPDIEIKLEFFPYDTFESKVQTSLISQDSGCDIYELWGGWAIDFAPTGSLAEIPEVMTKEILDDTYAPTTGALEYMGKLYGMPMEFNNESGGMLVNNAILQENNLKIPTSWEELVEEAKTATVREGDMFAIKGFDFANWDSVTYLFTSMILSKGGQYLAEDGTVDFNTPEAKDAFEELHKLIVTDKVADLEGLTSKSDIEGYQQIFTGTNLFVPRGPWSVADGISAFHVEYGKEFDYVEMPWYGDNTAFAAETGWSLAVSNNSKQKEAAFKFLEYFFQDDVLLQHNIQCSQIPPKKSIAQSQEFIEKMPYMKPIVGILGKAQFIGYFNTDVFKESINSAFVDYCTGIIATSEEALQNAQDNINASLK